MNRSLLFSVGTLLIVAALLAGGLVSVGLYRWEQTTRLDSQLATQPAAPAVPPSTTATAVVAAPPAISVAATPAVTEPTAASLGGATAGQNVYADLCDACHPGGRRGLGPALSGPEFDTKYGSDAALIDFIRRGTTGGMPGYPETRISDQQLGDLIVFIRTLGVAGVESTPTEVPVFGQLTWTGSYARNIQPIFDEYCVRCHGETLAENGLRLDTYEGVMQGTRGGAVVIPGSASGSTLVWVIQGLAAPEIRMPHTDRPLSPNRIENLIIWIDSGAPNN